MRIHTLFLIIFCLISCGIYNFSGANTGDIKTIQVDFFQNYSDLIEPTLSQSFTTELQNFFLTQTSMYSVKTDGDVQFKGEIVKYTIIPTTATANQTANQDRLTIEINIRFFNKKDKNQNFEKKFSHFYDYSSNIILQGAELKTAYEIIFEKIIQDIFNASIANW